MRYRTILLFGAPGCGKGTQGKIIGNIPGFHHNSTGDIFRSLDLQSETGRKFWEYSSRGQLVPDEFTIGLWKQFIRGLELINQFHPENEYLVLDGIPRNKTQADLLRDTLSVDAVIYLRAEKAKMIERLRRRALKENRIDDASDEVINKRMEVFERETRPTLDYIVELYPDCKVHRIDATMSQIRVLSEVVDVLVPLKENLDHGGEAPLGSIPSAGDGSLGPPLAATAAVQAQTR